MRQHLQKIIFICTLGVVLPTLFAHAAAPPDLPLVVKTDKGSVAGKMSADGHVRDFLGIPYAAAPVGPRRWQAPEPAAKWKDVRPATSFGAHCMQPKIFDDIVFRDPGQSEDCLTLNVWTPAKDASAKLPVMVWIHGGGFVVGGSSEPRQDGERLAHKGVILVSMNYRLGVFGFFAGSDLAAESAHHAAGNYGLLDQQATLEWVKRNIKAFGGDPNNVTLFGESAGSTSVSLQMASPLSQGLVTKGIGESGGGLSGGTLSLAASEQRNDQFMHTAFGTSSVAKLRTFSAEKIMSAPAASSMSGSTGFEPNIDGYFLPDQPAAIYRQSNQAHIPLLAGWNKDEAAQKIMFSSPQPTLATLQELAQKTFGAQAPAFLRAYSANNDAEAVRAIEDYAGDSFIAYSTWAWLEAQVKNGRRPVYRYHFDLGSPVDVHHPVAAGAFHSDDIEYVFGNLDARPGAQWTPADRQLSEQIQSYWTNFAKTCDPNGPNLPQWPMYKAAGGWQVLHLDAQSKAQPDTHRDRYLFLQRVWK